MSSTLWEVQLGLTSDVERILNHKRRSNETRQFNQPKPRRRPAVQKLLVFRNPVECTRTALWLIANYNRIELANQKPQPMYLLNCLRINLLYYFQFAPSLVPSIVAFGTIKSFVRFVSRVLWVLWSCLDTKASSLHWLNQIGKLVSVQNCKTDISAGRYHIPTDSLLPCPLHGLLNHW